LQHKANERPFPQEHARREFEAVALCRQKCKR